MHLIGSENLARTANRVVLWMGEVVDVVDVSSDFRREEFRIERNLFGPGISIQPVKSANANGCAFSVFAVPLALFSGETPATVPVLVMPRDSRSRAVTLATEVGPAMGLAVDAADESEPAGVEEETAEAGCAFSSRSATPFLADPLCLA